MNKQKSIKDRKVLVTGSNGKTGGRVYERLSNLQWPILAGSRSAVIPFDWNDSNTWTKALDGIQAVYLSFYPDLAMPGAVPIIKEFTTTAVDQGVKQIVLLSGRGETEAQACEEVVINSGLNWTIIRSSWFLQNFSEGNFLEPILAGYVALPAGGIKEPFIDVDDIADIAVAALTTDNHHGKLYEVTGSKSITFAEAIKEISIATGQPIHYEQVSMEAYAADLKEYGLPPEVIELITYLFTEVLDGRNTNPTNGVWQALGRIPTDISSFAQKAMAAGAWQAIKEHEPQTI